jgi:DNA replicative helicase MCM subunit Mcm2 (Cdc46/Mcm family)
MNIIERLEALYARARDSEIVTIQDAIRLIELYDDALLTIASIDPNSDFAQSESGMINLIHMAKDTIALGQPQYNRSEKAPEETVIDLKKMAFDRNRHGSLYDRGSADSYYERERYPHWYPNGTYNGECVLAVTEEEIAEYMAGYDWNEEYGDKKGW